MKTIVLCVTFLVGNIISSPNMRATTLSLVHDASVNSGSAYHSSQYSVDYGALVVLSSAKNGTFYPLIQPNWSQYSGMLALPGASIVFHSFYGDQGGDFTPNSTGTSEIYGSTLSLSSYLGSGISYDQYAASNPIDEGSITWSVDSSGNVITVASLTSITKVINDGISGKITTIALLSPPSSSIGGNYVNGIGGNSYYPEEAINATLVPEPSTWAMTAAGCVALLLAWHRRASCPSPHA